MNTYGLYLCEAVLDCGRDRSPGRLDQIHPGDKGVWENYWRQPEPCGYTVLFGIWMQINQLSW